jgi:putative membrane protein
MEGQSDQSDLRIKQFSVAIIIIFHLVGLIGFLVPVATPYFIKMVPFHLLLMLGVIVFSYNGSFKRLSFFLIGAFLCGYLVEVLGVHTGKIFGNYFYGKTLGIKVASVPLLMGVNWIILIFSIGQMVKSFKIRNTILATFIGACFLIAFDFFMEPVAMKFDYWSWSWHEIPTQNYIAWFVVSVILLKFYYALNLKQQKYIGTTMFITQFVFFVVLYLAR